MRRQIARLFIGTALVAMIFGFLLLAIYHPALALIPLVGYMCWFLGTVFGDSILNSFLQAWFPDYLANKDRQAKLEHMLRKARAEHDVMKPALRGIEGVRGSCINRSNGQIKVLLAFDDNDIITRRKIKAAFSQFAPGAYYEIEVTPAAVKTPESSANTENK